MEPALAGRPARDFAAPRQPVSFRTWERGPTALSYDPYYTPPTPAEPEPEAEDAGAGTDSQGTDRSSAPKADAKQPAGGASPRSGGGGAGGPPSSPAQPLDP